MSRLIGILGGTFDPVHFGHLRPALEVMQQVGLAELRFIPNRTPPHRATPWLDDRQRAELVRLAIRGTPGFILDTRELERHGPSYMVDTLQSLREEFAGQTLCLVMGMDAFAELPQWHQWQTILELCHLIITTRPGTQLDQLKHEALLTSRITHDPRDLQKTPAGQILIQSVTQLDISASQIRQQLSKGHSIQYLLPEAVREQLEQAYVRQTK